MSSDRVLGLAAGCEADTIVVGARGRGAVVSPVLGSVSRGILRHADRPCIVVRTPSPRRSDAP
ncbi:MAG: universal stress protein [Gaiellales bacterium]